MAIKFKSVNKPNSGKSICNIEVVNSSADLKKHPLFKENSQIIEARFKDKKNANLLFYVNNTPAVIAICGGDESNASNLLEDIRALGSDLCKLLNEEKLKTAAVNFSSKTMDKKHCIAFLEGLDLMNYQFLKYKSKKKKNTLTAVEVYGPVNQAELNELSNLTKSVELARDLVNEPVIHLNAVQLSKEMAKAGKENGFSVKVLNKSEIEKLGMGGLLGVNMGSIDPPTFNILEWKPAKYKNKKPYVLVGKGVVYDTGGNNLKTGGFMSTMKCDMGGAAAVIGTINAIATNKLPVHVIGLIPATDNRIGKNAIVADDILKMYDGSTVEVQNTDAEGRLILADALAYAKQYKPELVIDLATLTGAAAAIVGTYGIATMGTADSTEKEELRKTGDEVYERLAEMPYWREYNDLLKSDIADIKNIGGPTGGAITAGKFLEHFTDYPWIHLDIAGPAFLNKAEKYKPSGGTGVGVRLLYHFFKNKAAGK